MEKVKHGLDDEHDRLVAVEAVDLWNHDVAKIERMLDWVSFRVRQQPYHENLHYVQVQVGFCKASVLYAEQVNDYDYDGDYPRANADRWHQGLHHLQVIVDAQPFFIRGGLWRLNLPSDTERFEYPNLHYHHARVHEREEQTDEPSSCQQSLLQLVGLFSSLTAEEELKEEILGELKATPFRLRVSAVSPPGEIILLAFTGHVFTHFFIIIVKSKEEG